jgi:geranylgeranyl diphosphate synthase type II
VLKHLRAENEGYPDRITKIMYSHSELKDLVEKTLANLTYNTEAEALIDPVRFILSVGGKRLRPVMTLMACNLFTDHIENAVIPAAGLEIFHNYTLVHDDIMDQALVRRNLPTIHAKWSLNQAILSGDVMAFIASDCLLQSPTAVLPAVLKIFNKAAIDVCIGQQLDMDFERSFIVSVKDYLRMIELKTATLISASLKIGAVIGEAAASDSELLYEFGRNLGLAFQIQDDLLDIYGNSKIFGKRSGGDIVNNKKTYPLVKALEIASASQKKMLKEQFMMKEFDPETKIKIVTDLYSQLNIKSVTETLANQYIAKSFDFLDKVSVGRKKKEELYTLVNSLIGRDK